MLFEILLKIVFCSRNFLIFQHFQFSQKISNNFTFLNAVRAFLKI